MEVSRTQKILSATHNEKMHNNHTEKVENSLTEISHKILCDIYIYIYIHMTDFTIQLLYLQSLLLPMHAVCYTCNELLPMHLNPVQLRQEITHIMIACPHNALYLD